MCVESVCHDTAPDAACDKVIFLLLCALSGSLSQCKEQQSTWRRWEENVERRGSLWFQPQPHWLHLCLQGRRDACLSILCLSCHLIRGGFSRKPVRLQRQPPQLAQHVQDPMPDIVFILLKVSTSCINIKSLICEIAWMGKSRNLEDPNPT